MQHTKRKFFLEFFKKGSKVGSVWPSSRFLTKRMLHPIDFSKDLVIVELGPGTGVFTKEIVKRMSKNSRLYSFELNPEFVKQLRADLPDERVKIVQDSAEKIKEYLSDDGLEKADYIVSALPFSLFKEELREAILSNCYNELREGGIMTQFQYSTQCRKLFEQHFSKIKTEFTFFNIPPAFVYICKK